MITGWYAPCPLLSSGSLALEEVAGIVVRNVGQMVGRRWGLAREEEHRYRTTSRNDELISIL